jgi:glucosylceramidase
MKTRNIFVLMAEAFLFTMTACSNSTIDIDNTPDINAMPNPLPAKGEARLFTTTADGVKTLSETTAEVKSGTNMAPTTLQIDPSKQYQSIDGFGFAITYSTCYNLLKMTPEARKDFLTRTYSPQATPEYP